MKFEELKKNMILNIGCDEFLVNVCIIHDITDTDTIVSVFYGDDGWDSYVELHKNISINREEWNCNYMKYLYSKKLSKKWISKFFYGIFNGMKLIESADG